MARSKLSHFTSQRGNKPGTPQPQCARALSGITLAVTLAGFLCGVYLAGWATVYLPQITGLLVKLPAGQGHLVDDARSILRALPLGLGPNLAPFPPDIHPPTAKAFIEPRSDHQMPTPQSAPPEGPSLNSAWSAPENLSQSDLRSANPTALVDKDGRVHAFWEEGTRVFHRMRVDGQWTAPNSIATGVQPAAGLTSDGAVHVAFSNEFAGQTNVFHSTWAENGWSLPRIVSRTSGESTAPALATDGSGTLHAVWEDTTPGYSVIYHGWLQGTWLYEMLNNARGTAPGLISVPAQGTLHVAWQSRGISAGPQEIFHFQGTTYAWSLPENISYSPDRESESPAMACDGLGQVHLVWEEARDTGLQIMHAYGQSGNWSPPQAVSDPGVNAHGPAIAVSQRSQVNVVWRQGSELVHRHWSASDTRWRDATPLVSNASGLDEAAITSDARGELQLVWGGWDGAARRDVFYASRVPILKYQTFLPLAPARH